MSDLTFNDPSILTPTVNNEISVSRWKAAGIHFLFSIGVVSIILFGMLAVWYPQPYFSAMGGKNMLFILAAVDVVIGPLITLIIFNPKKKSLKFDLAVIAIIQIAALGYGVYTLFQARPVYTVFVKNEFKVVSANDLDDEQRSKVTRTEFKTLPVTGPTLVVADEPTNVAEQTMAQDARLYGMGLQNMPQSYIPYNERVTQVLAQAQKLAVLQQRNPTGFKEIEDFLSQLSKKNEEVVFLPLNAKKQSMTVLIDAKSGAVIKILAVSPWR